MTRPDGRPYPSHRSGPSRPGAQPGPGAPGLGSPPAPGGPGGPGLGGRWPDPPGYGPAAAGADDAPPPGGGAGPDPDPRGGRGRRRRRSGGIVKFISDKGIPLLIAILGLLAALATTWGALKTADVNELEESQVTLERGNEDLVAENEALREQIRQLEDDLAAAEAEPVVAGGSDDGEGGSGPPVTSGPSSRTASVLRETGGSPLTFSSGYSIDLDSNAPDWEVRQGTTGGDFYFSYSGATLLIAGEVSLVDHVPAKQECEDATVLFPTFPDEQARDGTQFCMRTDEERVAYIHVVDIDEEAKTVTVDIIVWE